MHTEKKRRISARMPGIAFLLIAIILLADPLECQAICHPEACVPPTTWNSSNNNCSSCQAGYVWDGSNCLPFCTVYPNDCSCDPCSCDPCCNNPDPCCYDPSGPLCLDKCKGDPCCGKECCGEDECCPE